MQELPWSNGFSEPALCIAPFSFSLWSGGTVGLVSFGKMPSQLIEIVATKMAIDILKFNLMFMSYLENCSTTGTIAAIREKQ